MKKLLISVISLCMVTQLKAQNIEGSWMGLIPAGGANLHLVFNIKKTSGTSYSTTLDSPDQKAFGIACSDTRLINDSIFIKIARINAVYKGLWDGKDGINGTYQQGSMQIALAMKRITAAEEAGLGKEPARPQTPRPPFNYYTEDVEYDNAGKSLHYGATFTRPNGSGKYPAVIIITGSGTQDRDGTLFGHKLYWVLADYLTKNGIAVLRVDDRGADKSSRGEDINNKTSLDFSYDVETSLNYLESRPDVDKRHVGLIGHSEGGIIAPMVAARRKDISFIVMWGAPEAGGAKLNTEQNGHALKNAGIDSIAVNAFMALHQQVLNLFASSASIDVLDKKITPVFEEWKKAQSTNVLTALYVNNNSIVGKDVFAMYNSLYNIGWMRFFISYNPTQDLSKVKCSILAVNGAKDTQVNAAENLGLIKQTLTKSGNKDFEVKELPGLNHLLQTAVTGEVGEYEKIEETMSPMALNIICSWIKLHTD
jgi:fermentation-respiration switch protein FrsA (DUF1100 family)